MKILYHLLHPNVNAAERWIFESWRDGFEHLGHKVEILKFEDSFIERIQETKPDLFMTDICVIDLNKYGNFLLDMKKLGMKIAIWVHWPLINSAQHNKAFLMNYSIGDLYFGERVLDGKQFFLDTGKKYNCIPNSANYKYHYPCNPNKDYSYDIVYVGSRLPHKKWFEVNILKPLLKNKKYKVKVIGRGWSKIDFFHRILRKMLIILNLPSLKNFIEKMTVKISIDDERLYYSSSKICLNFHERDPDGKQSHYIINQRAFKIPACGGFQICDEVEALRDYFSEDEIVLLPLDKSAWLKAIDYYLEHDEIRENMRKKSTLNARKNHTSVNRCEMLLNLIKENSK